MIPFFNCFKSIVKKVITLTSVKHLVLCYPKEPKILFRAIFFNMYFAPSARYYYEIKNITNKIIFWLHPI